MQRRCAPSITPAPHLPLPLEGAAERGEAGLARAIVEMAFSPHHHFSFRIKKDARKRRLSLVHFRGELVPFLIKSFELFLCFVVLGG